MAEGVRYPTGGEETEEPALDDSGTEDNAGTLKELINRLKNRDPA